MLNATQAISIEGTQKYFETVLTQGDYYIGQECTGTWNGKGAEILGLGIGSPVTKEEFKALLTGYHPKTGAKLVQKLRSDRRPGTDLTFSVPKSVSLLWAINQEERILEALRSAVQETMSRDVEPLMCRRVRAGGKANSKDRTRTGNLIYADFLHKTSRAVDGKVDPHLHIHAFVMNCTAEGSRYYAAEMEEIVRSRPYLQASFEARLAKRLKEKLNYDVEKVEFFQTGKNKSGWEIKGISRQTIEKFSTRTQQVEAYAKEHAIKDASLKGKLGIKTRDKKVKGVSVEKLRREWQSRLTPQEQATFTALKNGAIGSRGGESESRQINASLRYALDHHLYRQSTVEKQTVVATALEHGLTLLPEDFGGALKNDEVIRRSQNVRGVHREYLTTRSVLDAESRMIAFAREGRGTRMAIGRKEHFFERDWLNDQQKQAVRHVLDSRDTVTAVTGGAGTGKTSLMQEAAEAIEKNAKKLFVFAPSTGAREVLEEKGFSEAKTVEHLLRNEKLHAELKEQVLWIDEAGQIDVRAMNGIFDIAKQQNARVVLSGDTRQHASPRRGEAMRILEKEAGLNIARVEKIQRQKGRYKRAVELISQGHTIVDHKSGLTGMVAGFDMLDRMGKIKQIDAANRHEVLAQQYLNAPQAKPPLVVAPTHAEGRAATQSIREGLRAKGAIGKKEREILQLQARNLSDAEKSSTSVYLGKDMVVQFHQNVKGGYKRGERYRVSHKENGEAILTSLGGGTSKPIPYDHPDRFEVYSENRLGFSVGDKIRFSLGGKAVDGKRRISNGRLDQIEGFDRKGNIRLKSGMTVSGDYGHIDLGYVTTSHASQGKDREQAIAAIGSQSLPAVNAKQFYVTVSRGSKDVTIYVDDKKAVRRAIQNAGEQLSATELSKEKIPQQKQSIERSVQKTQQRRKYRERVLDWWQARFPSRLLGRVGRQIPSREKLSGRNLTKQHVRFHAKPELGRS